ncbi:MAG: hypothetical protein V4620_08015 [Bacteroidota bacterium]
MISINRIKHAGLQYGVIAFLCFFLCVNNLSASNIVFSPTDTLKAKKEPILSFAGSKIAYDFFIYPNNNLGQTYPNYVHRVELSPTINLAGLRFSSSFRLSTEDIIQGHNINQFNISFNQQDFKKALRKNNAIEDKQRITQKIDSLKNSISEAQRKYHNLNEKLDNPTYNEQLNKAKAIKNKANADTNYFNNNKEKVYQAEQLLAQHQFDANKKINILKSVDSLQTAINKYETIKSLNAETTDAFDIDSKGRIKKMNTSARFYNIITNPSRLEIFDVSPNWSPLFFSGINLRGGIIEYNTNNIIAGFTAGFVNNINWYESVFNRDNFIYSGRLGYGNLEKSNIIFTYLKGTNNSQNNLNPIKENDVLGIQLNIHITENHLLLLEKAWSNQSNGDYTQGLNEVVKSSSKSFNNSAFNIKYNGNINQTKTRIEAKVKLNELYFYSMGAPANRKDVFKSQLNVKQVIFKNRLDALALVSLDKDNISETKYASSTIQSLQAVLNLKLRKSTFKLDLQRIITTSSLFQGNIAEANIANLSMVKPYRLFRKQITTIALFNYVNTKTLFNDTSFNNYLLSVNNSITINNKLRINLNYTGAYKKAETTGNITNNAEVSSTYAINNFSITIKYAYLNISDTETRNTIGGNATVNFTNGLSGSLQCTYDHINNKYLAQNNFISLQTRLVYTF